MWQAGATLHRGARASHYRGPSRCGAQAPDAQAQQLGLTGLVALRHVGSSQTRARTRVPCIGRQTLNHCATREALLLVFALSALSEKEVETIFSHSSFYFLHCWSYAEFYRLSLIHSLFRWKNGPKYSTCKLTKY